MASKAFYEDFFRVKLPILLCPTWKKLTTPLKQIINKRIIFVQSMSILSWTELWGTVFFWFSVEAQLSWQDFSMLCTATAPGSCLIWAHNFALKPPKNVKTLISLFRVYSFKLSPQFCWLYIEMSSVHLSFILPWREHSDFFITRWQCCITVWNRHG